MIYRNYSMIIITLSVKWHLNRINFLQIVKNKTEHAESGDQRGRVLNDSTDVRADAKEDEDVCNNLATRGKWHRDWWFWMRSKADSSMYQRKFPRNWLRQLISRWREFWQNFVSKKKTKQRTDHFKEAKSDNLNSKIFKDKPTKTEAKTFLGVRLQMVKTVMKPLFR